MVEHPFFLEVDANYLRSEREREATRDRLGTVARGGGRTSASGPGTARLWVSLLSVVNQVTRVAAWTSVLSCSPALASGRPEQRPVVAKRQGLAAILALGVLLGAVGPAEAAGSVGSSGAGNDYGRLRASAGER